MGKNETERRLLERLYEDTMTLSRAVVQEAGGFARHGQTTLGSGIPCGLSFDGDKSRQTANAQTIDYDVTVFAAPELDIQPGDTLLVDRCGRVYTYEVVGFPAVYPSHQAIKAKGRGLA